jgi:hypothetical protein
MVTPFSLAVFPVTVQVQANEIDPAQSKIVSVFPTQSNRSNS